jgi:hypothetical protein
MPATKKRPAPRIRKKTTTNHLAKELAAVKAEVALLQDKCRRMNRTLVHLICPKEWLTEEVDDDELWAKAIWKPSLKEVIENIK